MLLGGLGVTLCGFVLAALGLLAFDLLARFVFAGARLWLRLARHDGRGGRRCCRFRVGDRLRHRGRFEDVELDPSVLGTTVERLVVGDGLVRTVALGCQSSRRNPVIDQPLHDAFGATLREVCIVGNVSSVIGMTLHR